MCATYLKNQSTRKWEASDSILPASALERLGQFSVYLFQDPYYPSILKLYVLSFKY